MTTFLPYQPPPATDVLTAYAAFSEIPPGFGILIEDDPKGPVNKIVSLVRGNLDGQHERIKAALWPAGNVSSVALLRVRSGYTLTELFALRERRWNTTDPQEPLPPRPPAGWYVEIDHHTALFVSEADIWPTRALLAPPRVSWHVRARQTVRFHVHARARQLGDAIAHRLGYVHEDEASTW